MILTITNTGTDEYDANGVTLPAGRTIIIPDHHLNDVHFTNDTHRVTYYSVTQSYWHPFVSGNSGNVPEFDSSGSAAEKLFVAYADDISDVRGGSEAIFTNRGENNE